MKLMSIKLVVILTVNVIVMAFGQATARAAVPDNVRLVVPQYDAGGPAGTIGSFAFDQVNNAFWTVVFGSDKGIRRYDVDSATSDLYVWPTDIQLFGLASDVPGGIVSSNDTGSPITFSFLLNPKPLDIPVRDPNHPTDPNRTVTINYPAGTIGFIVNTTIVKQAGLTERPTWTKFVFRYDLRKIADPTSAQPDYDTAQDGVGGVVGQHGFVDWNDPLTVAATLQDFRTAAGVGASAIFNIGRQFAWSTDGAYIYIVDHGSVTGGVYRLNAATGALSRVYSETGSGNLISEPTVIPSSTRSLGGAGGDQILFDGTSRNGNTGGISFIVDSGGTVSGPNVAIGGETLRQFIEAEPNVYANITSIGSDPDGNIYFYDSTRYAVHRYDTLGRLVTIKNRAQEYAFEVAQGGTGSLGGGDLRLQTRDANHPTAGLITEVLFRGSNKWVAGIYAFRPGDLNRDGVIDANDTNAFITQLRVSQRANNDPNRLPWAASDPNFLNYIAADFNASAEPNANRTGLKRVAVTDKDRQVLLQFAWLWNGDLDWDGDVDAADQAILIGNLGKANPIWFDGDLDGDGDVDLDDKAILDAQLGITYTIDPGENRRGGLLPGFSLTLVNERPDRGHVTLDPPPASPNFPTYPSGTIVTLTAVPVSGKAFDTWEIYDPNHPGDANRIVADANNPITIVFDRDHEIHATFKCGSGIEPLLPLIVITATVAGFVSYRRRR